MCRLCQDERHGDPGGHEHDTAEAAAHGAGRDRREHLERAGDDQHPQPARARAEEVGLCGRRDRIDTVERVLHGERHAEPEWK